MFEPCSNPHFKHKYTYMSSICIKCGNQHNGLFGSGKYCSRKCSNSRIRTEEVRSKISNSIKEKLLKEGKWGCLLAENRSKRVYRTKSIEEKVNSRPFNELSWDYKRWKILLEQNYTCCSCGLKEWLGQKISLEIDHKDGNSENNIRENLHAICPNCHSLTKNFRGRNKLKGKFPIDRVFYEKYKELGNIRKTLLHFNLAAKGGNYASAKHIIQRFEPQTEIATILYYDEMYRKE